MSLDLPLLWAMVIAAAVFLYVLLDGFHLGIGIQFPFDLSPADRHTKKPAIAPDWDGNENLAGAGRRRPVRGLPEAYAVLTPAFYLPIILMLGALILRGVAFEFRAHGRRRGKAFWTAAFAGGSITAAAAQGLILGGFIQGVTIRNGVFTGGALDWITPYSLVTALGLIAGYALLGTGWLMIKSRDELHGDARRWAWRTPGSAGRGPAGRGEPGDPVRAPFDRRPLGLEQTWVRPGEAGAAGADSAAGRRWPGGSVHRPGCRGSHMWPFIGAAIVFASGFLGLAASFFPYVAPYSLTFRTAANADNALALLTAGLVLVLPTLIGAYTVGGLLAVPRQGGR